MTGNGRTLARTRRWPAAVVLIAGQIAGFGASAAVHAADRPAPSTPGGPLTVRAQLHEAYVDMPLVEEVRNAGYMTVVQRERVLDKRFPADRALAVIDAVGIEGARRNSVDRFVTLGLQARLTLGPSGALKKHDVGIGNLEPRQALVLGWIRALIAGDDRAQLLRRGQSLEKAGAIQLLEQAVKLAPDQQAPRVALALATAAAQPEAKKACQNAVSLQKAARDGGKESIRLASAERVVQLALPLQKTCRPGDVAAFQVPVQLPPPLAEPGGRAMNRAEAMANGAQPQQVSVAFVVLAPVFGGWLADAAVAKVAGRTRIDEAMVEDVLKRDPTGDLAVALVNAAVLMQRISADDAAEVVWLALVRRHGLGEAALDKQKALKIQQLTGPEAMTLGYAFAMAGHGLKARSPGSDAALTATPQQLFAFGRSLLPASALLGPVMAMAHLIDLDRAGDLCAPMKRVDALRFVINKANLPDGPRRALLQALATVEGQCQSTQAPAK